MYALNIADWICTVALLRSGGFYEANPLMRSVIGEPLSGLIVKCLLPAVLLTFVYCLRRSLTAREAQLIDRSVSFVTTLYCALCVIHIVNCIILRTNG